MMDEKQYIEQLKEHAAETRQFFGNKKKSQREKAVCRAFLRLLGVTFEETELKAPAEEPTDVEFRKTRFQIKELLNENRRRGDELKAKEKKFKKATTIDELIEPWTPPQPMMLRELVSQVIKMLSKYIEQYGNSCQILDVLIYVNLKDRYLEASPIGNELSGLEAQRWRSVSILFPPYALVLNAGDSAPDFLAKFKHNLRSKWDDASSLFEA